MNDMRTFRALCEKENGNAKVLITIENTDGFRIETKTIEALRGSAKWLLENFQKNNFFVTFCYFHTCYI